MTSKVIDVPEYMRTPIMDVPTAYSLGCGLLAAVPTGAARTPQVLGAARGLRESLVFLRDSWSASLKYGPADRRAFDVVADASWRSLYYALYSLMLRSGTPEDDANAKLAGTLMARLFADKLSFTQLTYVRQWAHADRLIADIDAAPEEDDELDKPLAVIIDDLVGTAALAFIRRAHAAYGDALQITKAAKDAPGGVREPKRLVEVAIVQYVIALFASHPPNTSDATNALLAKALRPIDTVRAEQARTPPKTDAGTDGDPLPPPPPEPMGPPPDEPIPDVE